MSLALDAVCSAASGHPVSGLIARLQVKAAAPKPSGMAHKRHRDDLGMTGGRS